MTLCAVLPLKISGPREGRGLAYARNLLASLNHFWNGDSALSLTIVSPDGEVAAVKNAFQSTQAVHLTIVGESQLLPNVQRYPELHGWLRQMAIKLAFAARSTSPFYLFFDSDILCVRAFDETTFIRDGKAITDWEAIQIHPDYWANSSAMLRIDLPGQRLAIGMTPNIFSREIALACLDRLGGLSGLPWDMYFAANCSLNRRVSEEALYTIAGLWTGAMGRLHWGHPTPDDWPGFHAYAGLWDARSMSLDEFDPTLWVKRGRKGHFVLVQSTLGYEPSAIFRKIGPLMEAHTPRWPQRPAVQPRPWWRRLGRVARPS